MPTARPANSNQRGSTLMARPRPRPSSLPPLFTIGRLLWVLGLYRRTTQAQRQSLIGGLPSGTYAKFVALGQDYCFRASSPHSPTPNPQLPAQNQPQPTPKPLYTIPLFLGVPPNVPNHVDPSTLPDDGTRFISLGPTYANTFITIETLVSRLDTTVRLQDYTLLKVNPSAQPFIVWDSTGQRLPTASITVKTANIVVDPGLYVDAGTWDVVQAARWADVARAAAGADTPMPGSVYERFLQPPLSLNITLVFTPPDEGAVFTLEQLTQVIAATFADRALNLPQYVWRTTTFATAAGATAPPLVLIGSHYLGFYHTWVSTSDFQQLFPPNGTTTTMITTKPVTPKPKPGSTNRQALLPRPWPSEFSQTAAQLDLTLHAGEGGLRGGQAQGQSTVTRFSHRKVVDALGIQDRFVGVADGVGGSADAVANALWGLNSLTGPTNPSAEWLDRTSLHFASPPHQVDLTTDLNSLSLVFVTRECRTALVRAENVVVGLLAADYRAGGGAGGGALSGAGYPNANGVTGPNNCGTLVTTNLFSGSVERLNMIGGREACEIPAWVGLQRYLWLSLGLRYEWTIACPSLKNLTLNVRTDYDPFSVYTPLLVEAHIDDALMKYLIADSLPNTSANIATSPVVPTPTSKYGKSSPSSIIVRHEGGVTMAITIPRPPHFSVMPVLSPNLEPMLAWRAGTAGVPAVTIGGVTISNPTVLEGTEPPSKSKKETEPETGVGGVVVLPIDEPGAGPPPLPIITFPTTLPPAAGFVLQGTIELFGCAGVQAEYEVWEGPPPAGVPTTARVPPSIERATLKSDLHLSTLLPACEGSAFDSIVLRNACFYHQNYAFDPSRAVGWHLSADWVIDAGCEALFALLRETLGVKVAVVGVQAGLGVKQSWGSPLDAHSFTLEGVFAGVKVEPYSGLCLTRVGVRLLGIRVMQYPTNGNAKGKPKSVLEYGFGVFGQMDLEVPGSVVPLTLEYNIRETISGVELAADTDMWNNPMGVQGLYLSNVSFTTPLALDGPWMSSRFNISALFQYKYTRAVFSGTYASAGAFKVTATLQKFDMGSISDISEFVTGRPLALPAVNVTVGSATITIASATGLSISLQNVEVGGHIALDAALVITPSSATLHGDLTSNAGSASFGGIELKSAYLQVDFQATFSGRTADVSIGGEVDFKGLAFSAAAHIYPAAAPLIGIEWTLLGEPVTAAGTLALSRLVPEVKGTFLDLALARVVFAVASQDDPAIPDVVGLGYTFHQGVQICATLGEVAALSSLVRSPVHGLLLSAGWSEATGYVLDISLPAPLSLHLGKGLTTAPFSAQIQTDPPELVLTAGLNIPVARSPVPLVFTLTIDASLTDASATGELIGWWVNPLGVSKRVKVGPDVALSIDIDYATFLESGLPSGFGIRGGLMIGTTEAQLALSVTEDPLSELLSAEVQNLNLTNLVTFAHEVTGANIPQPPSNLMEFVDLKVYICPNVNGIVIGTITYPQGFSFVAGMYLFGKRVDVACAISTGEILIKGDVDNFVLGPLSVRGTNGPRAIVDCEIGTVTQHILIDGMITLFGSGVGLFVEIDILPEPTFIFHTSLKFADLLEFQLDAELIGPFTFGGLKNCDFAFDAKLEQHILQYIREQVVKQFDKARELANEGIESAETKVKQAKISLNASIAKAEKQVKAAHAAYEAKNKVVTQASYKAMEDYNASIAKLKNVVTKNRAKFDLALNNAQREVQKANIDRAANLANAERSISDAQRKMYQSIAHAQKVLDIAVISMHLQFGAAEQAVQHAQNQVDHLQTQIDALWTTAHQFDKAHWYEFWKKAAVAGLMTSIATLESSKVIADGVLKSAQGVLKSSDYVSKTVAIGTAHEALVAARGAGTLSLQTAQGSLQAVDATTSSALAAAKATVSAVQNGGDAIAFNGSIEALNEYQNTHALVVTAAEVAIQDLEQSVEYLEYKTALAALAVAKSGTIELEAALEALKFAHLATDVTLNVIKTAVEAGTEALDIQLVQLSGTLRGLVGLDGDISKPLTVQVKGTIIGKNFELDGEFDPRKTADLITAVFESAWKALLEGL